jgi:hypothetical protein
MTNFKNDPKSGRNGYTNSGFKRCVDVGWKVKLKEVDYIYTVIDINHEGYEDVRRIRIQTPKGKPSWFYVSEVEIFSFEKHPEYYL